jgi:hypothetical protein
MKVHFVLICEGSSDEALIPHLRSLLVDCGAEEATGTAPDWNRLPRRVARDIGSKVRAALRLESQLDLLFIHRDADSPDADLRYREISEGVAGTGYKAAWIGVIPIQETEAWLLLDESAIRRASGKPSGNVALNLPSPRHIEGIAHPKELLFEQILLASETSGRRYSQLRNKIPRIRRQLLSELKPGGLLNHLSSWNRLRNDIIQFLNEKSG